METDPNWYGHVFESIVGAHLAQIPNSNLFYWRQGNDEVDYVLQSAGGIRAIEIKSGLKRKSGRGLKAFAAKFKNVQCATWNYADCLQFMETGNFPMDTYAS